MLYTVAQVSLQFHGNLRSARLPWTYQAFALVGRFGQLSPAHLFFDVSVPDARGVSHRESANAERARLYIDYVAADRRSVPGVEKCSAAIIKQFSRKPNKLRVLKVGAVRESRAGITWRRPTVAQLAQSWAVRALNLASRSAAATFERCQSVMCALVTGRDARDSLIATRITEGTRYRCITRETISLIHSDSARRLSSVTVSLGSAGRFGERGQLDSGG